MNELFRKFAQTTSGLDKELERLHKQFQRLHRVEEKHLKADLDASDE